MTTTLHEVSTVGNRETFWCLICPKGFSTPPRGNTERLRRSKESPNRVLQARDKHELYTAEFQTRKKKRTEGWADLAEYLQLLTDKAYPDLQPKARERLALNQYLGQLSNPQVAFGVKQKRPTSLDDAVATTLELESYHTVGPTGVATVQDEEEW